VAGDPEFWVDLRPRTNALAQRQILVIQCPSSHVSPQGPWTAYCNQFILCCLYSCFIPVMECDPPQLLWFLQFK